MVNENELQLRKEEIRFTPTDLQELLEYKDVFIKFLKVSYRRFQLSLCEPVNRWKIEEIYHKMAWIIEVINSIENSQKTYTDYVTKQEAKKEDKQE